MPHESFALGRKAAIVVRDEALAQSLEFILLARGMTPAVGPALGAPDIAEAAVLVIDNDLGGMQRIAELRALGWDGLAVLLIEDADAPAPAPAPGLAVLEKPFVGADIVAIVEHVLGATP